MKIFLLCIIAALVLNERVSAQDLSPNYLLQSIEALYNNGQYVSAELEARRLQEQPDLNDSVRIQSDKWIAFSLIAQGKSAAAKDRFIALLKIDETFELDPVLTSPKILSVFNDAKVRFVLQKKNSASDSTFIMSRIRQEPAVSYRAVLFPGWEQLYQGRESAGWLFLGGGTLTLASGVTCEFLRADARTTYLKETQPDRISASYRRYNNYRKAEIYSFSLFAAVFIASEIDIFSRSDVSVQPAYSGMLGNQLLFTLRF